MSILAWKLKTVKPILDIGSIATYDLASRGANTSGSNQCWGYSNTTTAVGYGPGYQYNCIHSGLIKSSGDLSTAWYNFTLASAGTIFDENTTSSNPVTNSSPATESVCPKGWTLPSRAQTQTIGSSSGSSTYVSVFSPVVGGSYANGTLNNEEGRGIWWGSNIGTVNFYQRYFLGYRDNILDAKSGSRYAGMYIRCINKQKTVLDLTYILGIDAGDCGIQVQMNKRPD